MIILDLCNWKQMCGLHLHIHTIIFFVLVCGAMLIIPGDVILALVEEKNQVEDFTSVRNLLFSVDSMEALHSVYFWALTVTHMIYLAA